MECKDRESPLPGGTEPVAERLRAERPEASGLELDRIKLQAMSRASARSRKRSGTGRVFVRSRMALSLVLALGLIGGSVGVYAAAGGSSAPTSSSSSSSSQYCPKTGKPKPPPSGNKCGQP